MDNEYYSLDAILAENQACFSYYYNSDELNFIEKIECTFNIEVPGLGYLDNAADEHVKALHRDDQLPYWLAPTMLYTGWAGFNMPRPYNGLVQNAVVAEPRSVKIGALVGENGRWYAFGKMVVDLLSDPQAKELADILRQTFKGRLPDLMDQAQHFTGTASAAARTSGDDAGAEFRSGLDATERERENVDPYGHLEGTDGCHLRCSVFVMAQESARQVKAWYESSDKSR
ncbi:SubName: Full=Uncharacterized protein {ECO:0000313/EMBL:CCA67002.1} [Serendipita indica DSM 11827]|uniref:DNA replication complex GINS protein PSF3 n=1 Tax=Serendipita indica (strain DSM 11827) TaxID=1109443 RepID=G4T6P6_SERID|nr:SubName: Full=Uncharacterized protein {ECO:0000313/EMBL:CCA67002.1} [Serendipita indica DSM 11827]CCA67002.1 hypothetical protein PIIN_00839 [Serendipita indica DSM 11827]